MRRKRHPQTPDQDVAFIPPLTASKKKSRIALTIMGACYALVIAFAVVSGHAWTENTLSVALQGDAVREERLSDGTSVHHFDSGRQVVCRDGRVVGTNVPRLVRISPDLVARICGAPTRS